MLIKIYSEKQSRKNSRTNVFIGGQKIVLSWDKDCTTEIEEDLLMELLKIDSSVRIADKKIEKKIQDSQVTPEELSKKLTELENENNKLKKEIGILKEENNKLKEALTNPEETLEETLGGMKLKELQDVAKEAKLPEEEWEKFKSKKDITEYLLDKLKHQS